MKSISVGSCVTRDYTLHTRSLRNTAGRRAAQCEERRRVEAGKKMLEDITAGSLRQPLEARPGVSRRCERGRVPSDSSSGISDDASSSGSGSDRDSGIETGETGTGGLATWGHSNTVPVTFGIDQDDRSQLDTRDRDKIREALENGVRRMNLVEKQKTDKNCQVQEISPRKTRSGGASAAPGPPQSPLRVKLLFRKERSPILDAVLSEGRASSDPPIVRPHSTEYEVLTVEGGDHQKNEDSTFRKAKKGKSKRRSDSPSISPTKMKKLKLVLGSETMSTVNYSD